MNDLDLCLEVMPIIASLTVSDTVRDRGIIGSKGTPIEMAYAESNGHVTDDVT